MSTAKIRELISQDSLTLGGREKNNKKRKEKRRKEK